jgi:hypothetical protein
MLIKNSPTFQAHVTWLVNSASNDLRLTGTVRGVSSGDTAQIADFNGITVASTGTSYTMTFNVSASSLPLAGTLYRVRIFIYDANQPIVGFVWDNRIVSSELFLGVVESPTQAPTTSPTQTTLPPTQPSSASPTDAPTAAPSSVPTASPTSAPSSTPTASPTPVPTTTPTHFPTTSPTSTPTASPTGSPTSAPTAVPTALPTNNPTARPTITPTSAPTVLPTATPTPGPTSTPTAAPTQTPTQSTTVEQTLVFNADYDSTFNNTENIAMFENIVIQELTNGSFYTGLQRSDISSITLERGSIVATVKKT